MPTPPAIPRLNALTLDAIRTATQRYHQDGDAARWERDVAKTLAKAHQAAFLLGISERLGVPLDSPLLNARNLSKVERAQLTAIVQTQVNFLGRFVDVAPDLSEQAIDARSDMYALAPKQTYWTGWAGEDLECYPGGCEECYGKCRCNLRREGGDIYWDCLDDAASCGSCAERGAMQPYSAASMEEEVEA